MKRFAYSLAVALALICLLPAPAALAGGGGQNLLLVVNPNDEAALRVAGAYQQIRNVPDTNIVFVAPPTRVGSMLLGITEAQFNDLYVSAINEAISSRGLGGKIDYIAALGQPHTVTHANATVMGRTYNTTSLSHALQQLPNLGGASTLATAAPVVNALYQSSTQFIVEGNTYRHELKYDRGENNAIHSSVTHSNGRSYMMGGLLAMTGQHGNSVQQVIDNLQVTAAADGQRPEGTIYFMDGGSTDPRVNTRKSQWNGASAPIPPELDARGIPWQIVGGTNTGGTPRNQSNIRGVVAGVGDPDLPNGSTYTPGSWGDHVTSYGGAFGGAGQGKMSEWIAAGCAASSGTVVEPLAVASRFPHTALHVFSADGSTLGEAYYKSIYYPHLTQFLGDPLAQPYADVPDVQLTSGPAEGQTVSGTIQLAAEGTLDNPLLAAGVEALQLYVDGRFVQQISAAQGTFNVNTALLSDGRHELRVVAINDAAAESQALAVRHVTVNNTGRSVSGPAAPLTAAHDAQVAIPLTAAAGNGQVQRVELRHLGRTVGQVSGAGGQVTVDASQLAFGDNRLTPVAVYTDGKEVAGDPITLKRQFHVLSGRSQTPADVRTPGARVEYFFDKGQDWTSDVDFAATPDAVVDGVAKLDFNASHIPGGNAKEHVAYRATGAFYVPEPAEYSFWVGMNYTASALSIDGELLHMIGAARNAGTNGVDACVSIFLDEGEHDLELLVSNNYLSVNWSYSVVAYMRGPDGVTRLLDNTILYTVPEPSSVVCFGLLVLAVRRRRGGEKGQR